MLKKSSLIILSFSLIAGIVYLLPPSPVSKETLPVQKEKIIEKKEVAFDKAHISNLKTPQIPEEKKIIKTNEEQEKISQETERDFLKLKIPSTFSSSPKKRYQEIYTTFLISSFYLNEVAAGNLYTNKENLTKAFKGIALYFKEMESTEQHDSALALIEANHSALFHDALEELSPSEKTLIEEALKLQTDEQ